MIFHEFSRPVYYLALENLTVLLRYSSGTPGVLLGYSWGKDYYLALRKNHVFFMFFFTPRSANAKSLQKHVSIFVQDRVFSRYLCVFGENSSFLLSSREGNQDIELERNTREERARFA